METTLKDNVAKCVEKNISFDGGVGTVYTAQDLFHSLKQRSLNNLYKNTKKKLDSLDTDSLFDNSNTTLKNTLQLQVDTIKGVFEHNQAIIDLKKAKVENDAKIAKLRELRDEKELEAFKGKSTEEIDKEIAALEGVA